MKQTPTRFPKDIQHLHVPYLAPLGTYAEMYRELGEYPEPKGTKSIEIIHRCYIDYEDPRLSHDSSTIIFHK